MLTKVTDRTRKAIDDIVEESIASNIPKRTIHEVISALIDSDMGGAGYDMSGFYTDGKPHFDVMVLEPTVNHDNWAVLIFANDHAMNCMRELKYAYDWSLLDRSLIDTDYISETMYRYDDNRRYHMIQHTQNMAHAYKLFALLYSDSDGWVYSTVTMPHSTQMIEEYIDGMKKVIKYMIANKDNILYTNATNALDCMISKVIALEHS